MSAEEWVSIGTLYYFDADDRDRNMPLPHGGRGVLTWHGPDGKNSGQPPEDDLRLAWDDQYKTWRLLVRANSESADLWIDR